MSRKLKILFVPTNVSGVQFYRCWQPAEALRALGHKVAVLWYTSQYLTMAPWEQDFLTEEHGDRIERDIEMGCHWADVVVWMGLHTAPTLEFFMQMKARYGKPTLTEIDDYIFSIPTDNIASSVYSPGADLTKIILHQMKESDGLICSTPYLSDQYKEINRNRWVVENVIDLRLWRELTPRKPRQGLTIGWMGGGTHNQDHRMIKEAVYQVLAKNEDVKFVYVSGCECPDFFKHIPRLKWHFDFATIDKYPKFIQKFKFDIGIAPLVDNNFNRGKSNLRWLEYSAMGIPTVASPLPHFAQSIAHDKNGLLCYTINDWISNLQRLISAPECRDTIGKAARLEVKDKWNLRSQGLKYEAAIKELLGAGTDPG